MRVKTGAVLVMNAGSSSLKFSLYRDGDGDGDGPVASLCCGQVAALAGGVTMSASDSNDAQLLQRQLPAGGDAADWPLFVLARIDEAFRICHCRPPPAAWCTAARATTRRWSSMPMSCSNCTG